MNSSNFLIEVSAAGETFKATVCFEKPIEVDGMITDSFSVVDSSPTEALYSLARKIELFTGVIKPTELTRNRQVTPVQPEPIKEPAKEPEVSPAQNLSEVILADTTINRIRKKLTSLQQQVFDTIVQSGETGIGVTEVLRKTNCSAVTYYNLIKKLEHEQLIEQPSRGKCRIKVPVS
jgi:hypothetical protein